MSQFEKALTAAKSQVIAAFKEYERHQKGCKVCLSKRPCSIRRVMLLAIAEAHTAVVYAEHIGPKS